MFLRQLDLTTALRPLYLADEDLVFVQDNVGLYEGKYKILNQQNGQVYLTSHRICYVDAADPRRHSAAVDLKDVERYEFYAGFLKSSPKVTLYPKAAKRGAQTTSVAPSKSATTTTTAQPETQRPAAAAATWVCSICSFSNPVPSNFDPESLGAHTPMPPCLACGIAPALTHVLKAVIARAASRAPADDTVPTDATPSSSASSASAASAATRDASFQCPRCTFLNHPSLMACEMCGASLVSHDLPAALAAQAAQTGVLRTESPGPGVVAAGCAVPGQPPSSDAAEPLKLSFRGGGEKIFYERLKNTILQRKWLLHNAPPIPAGVAGVAGASAATTGTDGSATADRTRVKTAGIAGLEKRGLDMRKKNEIVIGSAFEDLEALMASAKHVVALAEELARRTGASSGSAGSGTDALQSATSQLGLVTTKDIVGSGSGGGSLYLSELARHLAEFLTDDARGVLRRAGGIMTLVDLWAVFNRARGGVELVSPQDMARAARLWESLRLPVRLRTFRRSGVLVVQGADRTDDATVRALLAWLADLKAVEVSTVEVETDIGFGRGVSAQEAAERFGWSIGVAEEELEMAEERGALCREEGIAGLRFWPNLIVDSVVSDCQ